MPTPTCTSPGGIPYKKDGGGMLVENSEMSPRGTKILSCGLTDVAKASAMNLFRLDTLRRY